MASKARVFDAAKASGDHFFYSKESKKDDGKTSYTLRSASSLRHICDVISRVPRREWHYHELLHHAYPVKLYMDIDFKRSTWDALAADIRPEWLAPTEFVAVWQPRIKEIVDSYLAEPTSDAAYCWCDGSRPEKLSLHLVINHGAFVAKDANVAKILLLQLMKAYPEFKHYSDTQVYSKDHNLRMALCRKMDSDVELSPMFDYEDNFEVWRKMAIQEHNDRVSTLSYYDIDETFGQNSTRKIKSNVESGPANVVNITDDARKFIAKTFLATVASVKTNNQACILSLNKKVCPFALYEHSSNHQYVVVAKNKAYEKCHSTKCKDQKSAAHDVPVGMFRQEPKPADDQKMLVDETLRQLVKAPFDNAYVCEPRASPVKTPNGSYVVPLHNMTMCPVCQVDHKQATNCLNIGAGHRYITCSLRPTEWYPDPADVIPANDNKIIFNINVYQQVDNSVHTNVQINNQNERAASASAMLLPYHFEHDKLPMLRDGDDELQHAFLNALNGNHCDIANFFYCKYADRYRCLGHNRDWFEYVGHHWQVVSTDIVGFKLTGDDFMKPFADVVLHYSKKNDNNDDVSLIKIKKQKAQTVFDNLRNHGFRMSVLKDCETIFVGRHRDFEEELNTRNLFPCANGVIDLDTLEFRPGQQDDAMSMATKSEYIAYDPANETVQEIERWMALVQPDPAQCEYLKKLSGYFLTNEITLQQMQIWTGSGRNAKSFYVEQILRPAMGQFYGTGATQLLTRKRENASETNEAMMMLLKKRVAVFSEPEKREEIQANILKQLSGCDEITARGLHRRQHVETPTFKSVLICNSIPKVSEDSYAVWRRIRIVNWPMNFKENPDPNNPFEALVDLNFGVKVKKWSPYFLGCLVHWLRLYREQGLNEPEGVVAHTRAYQEDNDEFIEYRQQHIMSDPKAAITWSSLRNHFRAWHIENIVRRGGKQMTPRGDEIKAYFTSKLGPEKSSSLQSQKMRAFFGYRLKE